MYLRGAHAYTEWHWLMLLDHVKRLVAPILGLINDLRIQVPLFMSSSGCFSVKSNELV